MKELDALIKALEKEGVIESLKLTVSAVPLPPDVKTEEEKQQLVNEAVKECLSGYFDDDENEEMFDLFVDYCWKLGLNELVKALNIKPSENTKDFKDFLHELIEDLFKK